MTVTYVDVSEHDRDRKGGPLDWVKIKAATSPCMCSRVSYGDPGGMFFNTYYASEFHTGAKKAGFTMRGGYHNLITGRTNEQVDYFRRCLDAVGANWAMLDIERYPELTSVGAQPRWADIQRWYDRWNLLEERVCTLYLPPWVHSGYLGSPKLTTLGSVVLVSSMYPTSGGSSISSVYKNSGGDSGPGWNSYGGVPVKVWQFSSGVSVPGATVKTDVNAVKGSWDDLVKMLGGDSMSASDVVAGLNTIMPYTGNPGKRLTDLGWKPVSTFQLLEYMLENILAIRADSGNALALVKTLATSDQVDEAALAAALAPAVAEQLATRLPAEWGNVSQDEVAGALKEVLTEAFTPKPA